MAIRFPRRLYGLTPQGMTRIVAWEAAQRSGELVLSNA